MQGIRLHCLDHVPVICTYLVFNPSFETILPLSKYITEFWINKKMAAVCPDPQPQRCEIS